MTTLLSKRRSVHLVVLAAASACMIVCPPLISKVQAFAPYTPPLTWRATSRYAMGILASNRVMLKSSNLDDTSSSSSSISYDNVYIMVNGMPGPMATAAAEACLRKGLALAPMAMTGPDMEPATITVVDPVTLASANVRLLPSSNMDEIKASLAGLQQASTLLLAIDYTHPSAVNGNGRFYVEQNIPFVMGTTGGNREQLLHDVQGHDCVIAPNMGKQIVAMQAALQDLGEKFPGAFAGYTLSVVESHQTTKADTSGTAKAVIDSIKTLTADSTFTYEDITMIRNEDEAMSVLNVPPTALKGHAFHTYTITSPDQSVQFELKHNVAGRTVYAEGTADAVKFLARQILTKQQADNVDKETAGRVYTMIDVLKAGALG
jgi:4-hydroxy-tetrahydrodipicolinate reductase